MATFRIVNLGDSVPWGQGLLEHEKYDSLVKDVLQPKFAGGVSLERLAHSGAIIGAHGGSGGPAPGEVPVPLPSVIEQCDRFTNSPETVDLVLVNGGINDVEIQIILDPLVSLSPRIERACHAGMLTLLGNVGKKFSGPSCQILVTGYFIILSHLSDPLKIGRLLNMHGIHSPALGKIEKALGLFNPFLERCLRFFNESNDKLQQAVQETNDPRIKFVPSGFTAANAMFAGEAFLWGLDHDLNPEDPIAAERKPQCDLAFPATNVVRRLTCHRASAGHPNPAGAVQYKNRILAAMV